MIFPDGSPLGAAFDAWLHGSEGAPLRSMRALREPGTLREALRTAFGAGAAAMAHVLGEAITRAEEEKQAAEAAAQQPESPIVVVGADGRER